MKSQIESKSSPISMKHTRIAGLLILLTIGTGYGAYSDVPFPAWSKQGTILNNTIEGGGGNNLFEPTVLYENNSQLGIASATTNIFKMWYTAGWNNVSLWYAESLDGRTWTKNATATISSGVRSFVFKQNNTYYWYYVPNLTSKSIVLSTSNDGLNFTFNKTVLTNGSWKNIFGSPYIWTNNNSSDWKMLYEARNNASVWSIGLATSSDGLNWTDYIDTPVINESGSVSNVGYIYKSADNTYYAWLHKSTGGVLPTDIYRYKSTNLINWTSDAQSLFRSTSDEGVGSGAGQVADVSLVLINNSSIYAYYTATPDGSSSTGNSHFNLAIINYTFPYLILKSNERINMSFQSYTNSFSSFELNNTTINVGTNNIELLQYVNDGDYYRGDGTSLDENRTTGADGIEINDLTYTSGRTGSAFSFSGTNRVSLPNTLPRLNNSYTVLGIIKPNTLSYTYHEGAITSDWSGTMKNYQIEQYDSGIRAYVGNGSTGQDSLMSLGTVTTTDYFLFALVVNGTTHKGYLINLSNFSRIITTQVGTRTGGVTTNKRFLGTDVTETTGYMYNGSLEDVMFIPRSLTEDELNQTANQTKYSSGYIKVTNVSNTVIDSVTINGTWDINSNSSIQYTVNGSERPTVFFGTNNVSINTSWILLPKYSFVDTYLWFFGNNTSTPHINNIVINKLNSLLIVPSSGVINTTVNTWNTTGDYYKSFNASGGNFSLSAGDNPRNARIQIKLNGSNSAIVNSNSTGYVTWNYNGSSAETQLEFNIISTGVGDGSISYPAIAVAGVLGVAASVAIYTIWRRRNGGRMYGFIPFL